jgi:hypothetical protein
MDWEGEKDRCVGEEGDERIKWVHWYSTAHGRTKSKNPVPDAGAFLLHQQVFRRWRL